VLRYEECFELGVVDLLRDAVLFEELFILLLLLQVQFFEEFFSADWLWFCWFDGFEIGR
jgi:hypothetical protein